MDINSVKEALLEISDISTEELEGFSRIIEDAVSATERALGETDSPRAVMLAAARANYSIALSGRGDDGITSFKAGDVSVTKRANTLENAKALYLNILASCADISPDEQFAFMAV